MFQRQIFRKESLQRLASPEELDRLFTVVGRKGWIALGALAGVCLLAVVWGILGRIPETVEGTGVLVNPGKVRGLQAPFGGQVIEVHVRVGQQVHKGDILAILNQPETQQQLTQARVRLQQLKDTDALQRKLEEKRLAQDRSVRTAQVALLESSIQEVKDLAVEVGKKTEEYTQTERKKLEQSLQEARALNKTVRDRLATLRSLSARHVETTDTLVSAEASVAENNTQLATLDLKLAELSIKDIENKQYQSQQQNRIADLKVQLNQLQLQATQLELEIAQNQATRAIQIQEQEDRIKQLDMALAEQGTVKSLYNGRVQEVATQAGQILQAGARVGAIEMEDGSPGEESVAPGLKALAYFPLKSGKRLAEGQQVRVTPTTVQRERYGSILGTVTRVSPFPITEESAATVVGNPELVRALVQPGGMIEVEIELERDLSGNSPSGFRWTSSGPPLKFSAGTTAGVRVTVEKQRPVTYLLPILRQTVFGDGN